jgi:hypothetical protein
LLAKLHVFILIMVVSRLHFLDVKSTVIF